MKKPGSIAIFQYSCKRAGHSFLYDYFAKAAQPHTDEVVIREASGLTANPTPLG